MRRISSLSGSAYPRPPWMGTLAGMGGGFSGGWAWVCGLACGCG